MDGVARKILCVLGSLIVAACGGGGDGGGGGGSAPPPQPPVSADPGGIWYGFASNTTVGETIEVAGVSIADGELRFVDVQGVQYHGSMTVSGNNFTASFKAVAQLGETFLDGSTVLTGNMSGTIHERESLEGLYQMSSGESGSVSLLYDALYERSSSMPRLTGTWMDDFGDIFSVDSIGRIFGQNSSGCVYSGDGQLIDTRYNAYRVDLSVSSCGAFNGSYTGLAVVDDWQTSGDNRLLILQLSNQSWSITTVLGKL